MKTEPPDAFLDLGAHRIIGVTDPLDDLGNENPLDHGGIVTPGMCALSSTPSVLPHTPLLGKF